MCTPAVLSPTVPPSIALTFGQFYLWPGGSDRSLSAVGGLITNDAGNSVGIAVRIIQTGGSAPSGTPVLIGTDYLLFPGTSIVGIGLAPPGTVNTEILGIYLFPVSNGIPTAWLSDVLSECPPGVVEYGGTFNTVIPQSGQALTSTPGTAVQIAPSNNYIIKRFLTIFPGLNNSATGVTVGYSTGLTDTTNGTGNGVILSANGAVAIPPGVNMNSIWINGLSATDVVSWSGG